jgi:RNA polymerase sigma-70 factor (ECF subfamily)
MSSSVSRSFLGMPVRMATGASDVEDLTPASVGEECSPQLGCRDRLVQTATDISSDSSLSDEKLLALTCQGDNEALASLFRRYARVVRGVAYRVLRDPSEADDLLQDIFILIHRLCHTFDSSKGSARFWILQMTHRRAISRRRYLTSRHFYNHLDLDETAGRVQATLTKALRRAHSTEEALEKKETLQNWFEQLSPNQRETLRLFFFEGYTFEEIAARLGQTTVNARQHYYRGLDRLRKQIFAGKLPSAGALW